MKKFVLMLACLSTLLLANPASAPPAGLYAVLTGWLPQTVEVTGQAQIEQNIQAQWTLGNLTGSSLTLLSVKPFFLQTGNTGGGSLTASAIGVGNVCLSGGPVGSFCNNVIPGTTGSGSSLTITVPMVFHASSSFPPYTTQTIPVVGQFGPAGSAGSSLTFGYGGSSVVATTGTYTVDATFLTQGGSYFTSQGGSTITITAIPLPDAF